MYRIIFGICIEYCKIPGWNIYRIIFVSFLTSDGITASRYRVFFDRGSSSFVGNQDVSISRPSRQIKLFWQFPFHSITGATSGTRSIPFLSAVPKGCHVGQVRLYTRLSHLHVSSPRPLTALDSLSIVTRRRRQIFKNSNLQNFRNI